MLRPRWLALKNRWAKSVDLRREAGRDIFLLFFSLLVMGALYFGTSWALAKVDSNPNLAFLPPSAFFGFVLLLLMGMMFLTSIMAAIGMLFLSEDLDLIMASPVSHQRFFLGRIFYVYIVSSWMSFLFALPFILAFGINYSAPLWFYPFAMLTLLPFFLIPSGLGVIVGTLIIVIVPSSRFRETCVFLFAAFVVGIYLVIDAVTAGWGNLSGAEVMVRMMASISTPQLMWLPSAWVGFALEEPLKPAGHPALLYLSLLVLSAVAAVSLAYLVLLALHDTAFSRIHDRKPLVRRDSAAFRELLRFLGGFLRPEYRALVGKEVRVITRDVGQVVQVAVLVVMALIYLYHLRIFAVAESFPEAIRPWWKNFLFMGNMMMGSFLATAMCTRFVFPSLSLEGRAFWILQTSPLEIKELLKVKFWVWFIPVSLLSVVFFTVGALAIGASGILVLVSAACSLLVVYGIVGLAIGLGGMFAYFEWEHPSQLAGGFGSLLYMLCATLLILLNTVPAWMILLSPSFNSQIAGGSKFAAVILSLNMLTVLALNLLVARFAFEKGQTALIMRMRE